jgi:uncharacterized protein YxjI
MDKKYTLEDLTEAELKTFSDEMNALLEKYNVEIGVKSSIQVLKRVETNGDTTNTTEETPEAN